MIDDGIQHCQGASAQQAEGGAQWRLDGGVGSGQRALC
jgi:hypothetical protein